MKSLSFATRLALILLLVSVSALISCGGGGGGGGSTTPPPVTPPVDTTPSPTISAMQPESVPAGNPSFTLYVTGTNFSNGAVILWANSAISTVYLGSTSLSATIPASAVATESSPTVSVRNPDGRVSSVRTFSVSTAPLNPAPVITSLSPAFAYVNTTFRVIVRGLGFRPGSKVFWNGSEIPSTYQNENEIDASISAANATIAGSYLFSVQTPSPGGGTSNRASFLLTSAAPSKINVAALHLVYDSLRKRLYASGAPWDPVFRDKVVVIDPSTATIVTSIPVGAGPESLALSQDKSLLWVGSKYLGTIQKIDLNTLTPGPEMPLGNDPQYGTIRPVMLAAMPGSPLTVAVSRDAAMVSSSVAIYDDGVARPNIATGSNLPDRILFPDTPDTLLGSSSGVFKKLSVDAQGVTLLNTNSQATLGWYSDLYFDSGRLYSTFGTIVDTSGQLVGVLPGVAGTGGAVTRDVATGRILVLNNALNLLVYDQASLLPVGFIPLAADAYLGGHDIAQLDSSRFAFISNDQIFIASGNMVPAGSPTVATTSLPATSPGKIYDFSLTSYDATSPLSWTLAKGSGPLPPGLELQQQGRIYGKVGAINSDTTYNFTVLVTDSSRPAVAATKNLSIQVKTTSLGSNNECATATPISPGRLAGSLSPYGDIDVYSFDGTAGANITVETFAARLNYQQGTYIPDPPGDTVIQLLNSSCSPVAVNDDQPGTLDSLIAYKLPTSGKYYIRVLDSRGDGRPDFLYELELTSK